MTADQGAVQVDEFGKRYGPWAVVVGASEGVGTAAAAELAARGVNLVLTARNTAQLESVASDIQTRHDVQVRTLPLDLTAPDAVDRLLQTVEDLEIGLLLYCPGAVHNSDHFVDQPIELPMRMIILNCTVPTALIHALAPPMRHRGHGGVVLVGSLGCFVGSPRTVAYSAAKAFQVNLIEGLWAELHNDGVDLLSAVIGSTTTPARARTLGVQVDDSLDMSSEEVAHQIIDNIANGPNQIIAKLTSGIGFLAEPWADFRTRALTTMIEAVEGFTARTTSDGS
jgi:short-subunit dehydrogenase